MSEWLGGLELGGTKAVAAIGTAAGEVIREHRYPTTTPEETLQQAIDWWRSQGGIRQLGIASFGPIRLSRSAADFGHFLRTPKLAWQGFSLGDFFQQQAPEISWNLETDVIAAVLAEQRLGAARGQRDAVYITVGTGIGAGVMSEGQLVHGTMHPEMGHLRVPRHPDDTFAGVCPFHGDCWEGLASGPAIEQRWGKAAHELPHDHPAWEMQAYYLAQGIFSACAILSPAVVILGGGVSQAMGLHERVGQVLDQLSAGYFENLGSRVVAPALGQQAGIVGALLLADR